MITFFESRYAVNNMWKCHLNAESWGKCEKAFTIFFYRKHISSCFSVKWAHFRQNNFWEWFVNLPTFHQVSFLIIIWKCCNRVITNVYSLILYNNELHTKFYDDNEYEVGVCQSKFLNPFSLFFSLTTQCDEMNHSQVSCSYVYIYMYIIFTHMNWATANCSWAMVNSTFPLM